MVLRIQKVLVFGPLAEIVLLHYKYHLYLAEKFVKNCGCGIFDVYAFTEDVVLISEQSN